MNRQNTGLKTAGAIFGLMALAQLLRLIVNPEVLVAGHRIPLWPSMLAFGVLAALSVWMWKLAHSHKS